MNHSEIPNNEEEMGDFVKIYKATLEPLRKLTTFEQLKQALEGMLNLMDGKEATFSDPLAEIAFEGLKGSILADLKRQKEISLVNSQNRGQRKNYPKPQKQEELPLEGGSLGKEASQPPEESKQPASPNKKLFKHPSIEQCKAYAKEVGLPENIGERFFYHYEQNGWMVGKNPMKSWKIALGGTWKSNYKPDRDYANQPALPEPDKWRDTWALLYPDDTPPPDWSTVSQARQQQITATLKKRGILK